MEYGLSTTLSGVDCYLNRLPELKRDGMDWLELCLRKSDEGKPNQVERAVKSALAEGLRIFSVHLPFGRGVNPACPDPSARMEAMDRVRRFVDQTAVTGAGVYVIHASCEPVPDEERSRQIEAAVRSLEELCGYLADRGAVLALENLPRTCIGNTAEEIGYFTGRIPQLRLCLDTNHFTSPRPDVRLRPFQRRSVRLRRRLNPVPPKDNGVEFARRFAGRIVTVHFSDYDGIDECHWLPGQGCVDFKGIQHSLLDAGFDSPMIFEPNERCRGVRTTGKQLIRRYEKQAGILR